MLILSRKLGESIIIKLPDSDREIEIMISEISGDKVKVGINADKEIKILRKELVQTTEVNIEATGKKTDIAMLRNFMKGL
ncbi:MAG: carbon storage regulator [Oscillospiraceae bacterium]